MSEPSGDREPKVSRHAARRRRSSTVAAGAALARAIPPCPGLNFRRSFPGGRSTSVDLTGFPRPRLAAEAADMLWSGCHDGTYKSRGAFESATQMLARLAEYLTDKDRDGRVGCLGDLREEDVDGFDLWLHDERYEAGSVSPHGRIQGLVAFMRQAIELKRADPSLSDRLRYTSKFHDAADSAPRDAYDDFTMAGLRAAARADVDRILGRLREGEVMAARGGPPEALGSSTPSNVVWSLRERGMVDEATFKELERTFRRRELTAPQILDLVYLSIADCVPFLILLAETTGLPIESVKELEADCLDDPDAENGFTVLRYVKRRRSNTEERFEEQVSTRERHSAGWLVRELIELTAPARRELGFGPREGPLLIGRVALKVKVHVVSNQAVIAWHGKNPISTDRDGGLLESLHLSRIRKWRKASIQYVGGGGALAAVRDDHSKDVFVRHYGNIPFLRPRHDAAVAAGIQEAHDVAMRPHVLTGDRERDLTRRPAEAARALATTEDRVRGVASGERDSWLAGCLDFHASPFAPEGQSCGAPLYGCLDCANAVFTTAKIPNLLRLASHVAAERQRMDLDLWRRNFGFAYLRIRQILDMYPPEDVEAAAAETTDAGRDFMLTQLTYRTRRT